mmetsp:Transcript_1685/g.3394  ORF Transcript_1685/g.3394 Transcript_1685/m.3394 type:complete len:238 (-) Transcript_1685:404-1117(-)
MLSNVLAPHGSAAAQSAQVSSCWQRLFHTMGWSRRGSFSQPPSTTAPISRPRNAYCSNCRQWGFGRNASRWKLMPSSASGTGTKSGVRSLMSSSAMVETDSRKPPPASMTPSFTNFTFHHWTLFFAQWNQLGSVACPRARSLAKICSKTDHPLGAFCPASVDGGPEMAFRRSMVISRGLREPKLWPLVLASSTNLWWRVRRAGLRRKTIWHTRCTWARLVTPSASSPCSRGLHRSMS